MNTITRPIVLIALMTACGTPQAATEGAAGAERFSTSTATSVSGHIESTIRDNGARGWAAAEVVATTWTEDGDTYVLGEGEVDASGDYTIDFDDQTSGSLVLITAIDARGRTVGYTMAEDDGDTELDATPMTRETSLEAKLFARVVSQSDTVGESSWTTVRSLVTADLTAAAFGSYGDAQASHEEMIALSTALTAALTAESEGWSDAGFDLTAAAEARVEAAAAYSEALADGERRAVADANFDASLEAIFHAEGADEYDDAELASRVGLVFRGMLEAHGASDEVQEAAARGTLEAEASAWTEAMVTLLNDSGEDAAAETVLEAGADLSFWLESATSTDEMEEAIAEYRSEVSLAAELTFEGESNGGLLGGILDLDAVFDFAADLSVEIGTWLDGEIDDAGDASADGSIDAETAASVMVEAWLDARGELADQLDEQFQGNAEGSLAIELLIASEGSFQYVD